MNWPSNWTVLVPRPLPSPFQLAPKEAVPPGYPRQQHSYPLMPGAVAVIPNFSDWQRGDSLLYSPLRPNIAQMAIQRFQVARGIALAPHTKWTHVAIYVGAGRLCHAIVGAKKQGGPTGICLAPVSDLTCDGYLRLRRPLGVSRTDLDGAADLAITKVGQSYSSIGAMAAVLANRGLLHAKSPTAADESYICATMIDMVYIAEANISVLSMKGLPSGVAAVPAIFSLNPNFLEVDACWRIEA